MTQRNKYGVEDFATTAEAVRAVVQAIDECRKRWPVADRHGVLLASTLLSVAVDIWQADLPAVPSSEELARIVARVDLIDVLCARGRDESTEHDEEVTA